MAAAPGPSPLAGLEPHRLRSARERGAGAAVASAPAQSRGFVPIELLGRLDQGPGLAASGRATPELPEAQGARRAQEPAASTPPSFVLAEPDEDWTDRTSLFGDGDR